MTTNIVMMSLESNCDDAGCDVEHLYFVGCEWLSAMFHGMIIASHS